jgi:hypothetical protein
MKKILPGLGLIVSLVLSQQSFGLTFKTGQVIGPDGKSYVGMSPQNKANLIASSSTGVITSGFMNKQFYLVSNGQVTTVPVAGLRNKTSAQRMTLIKQSVMNQSLANLALTNQAIGDLETHTNVAGLDDTSNTLENSFENAVEHDLEHSLGGTLESQLENDLQDHLENNSFEHQLENDLQDHLENNSFERQVNHEVEGNDGRDNHNHDSDNDNHDSNDNDDD